MIGSIWRAALSLSQSLTQNITISTGPMVRGSSHVDLGQVERRGPAFDRDAALAHGGKMRAARNEMNISTAPLDEPGAEIPAHAPRAHDRNSQRALQPQADAAILCPRSALNRLAAGPLCGWVPLPPRAALQPPSPPF